MRTRYRHHALCLRFVARMILLAGAIALAALPLLFGAGCTRREVSLGKNAPAYRSWRFGTSERIGEIEVRFGTNVFRVKGYEGDQVAFAKEVTAAAVSSAIGAAAPTPGR